MLPMIEKLYRVATLLLAAAPFVSPVFSREIPRPSEWTRFEFTQVHMGTEFKILLYAPDADAAAQASNAAFERISTLDTIMSDYNPGSELMQLCEHAGGPAEHVSDDLFRVLSQAQELSRRSNGAFDVTVGPVIRLWRQARARGQLPDPARLGQALKLVGYQNLRLDTRNRTAELLKSGMLLDLGGIAKGYAADQAVAILKARGIPRALVAGAGDIAAGAPPPGRDGWVIEVAPLDPQDKIAPSLFLLHDGAVSTSGDSGQHLEVAGVRYSHIINPKTGLGLTGQSSVSVVAANGISADSLATAVSVLGPARGLELIKSYPGAGVLFAEKAGQGVRNFQLRFPRTTPAKLPQ